MNSFFPKAAVISSVVAKDSSLLLITPFEVFNQWTGFAFCQVERLYFVDIFGMDLGVHLHKEIAVSSLYDSFWDCSA